MILAGVVFDINRRTPSATRVFRAASVGKTNKGITTHSARPLALNALCTLWAYVHIPPPGGY
eukprot:52158-Alexandrium_andersonii.AAC.1